MGVGSNNYSSGWYSVSPAFAWWNFDTNRLAAVKDRQEATRIAEEDKRNKVKAAQVVTEKKSIDVYA
tara:strand:- start:657 stop:857 length:201 start_codon:yes stop_codon:yes gene_type:complete